MKPYRSLLSPDDSYTNNDNALYNQMKFLSNSNEYTYFINSLYGDEYKHKTLSQRCTPQMKEIPCVSARLKLNDYLNEQYINEQKKKFNEENDIQNEENAFYMEWLRKQERGIDHYKINEILDKRNMGNKVNVEREEWSKRIEDKQLQSIEIERNVLDRMSCVDPYSVEYREEVRRKDREGKGEEFRRVACKDMGNDVEYDIKENQNVIDEVNFKLYENQRKKRAVFGKFNDAIEKSNHDYNNEMLYHKTKLNDISNKDSNNNKNTNLHYEDNSCNLNNTTPLLNCFQFRRKKDRKTYSIK